MTITYVYLMIGLFIAWLIALILTAGGATYIENLVKKDVLINECIKVIISRLSNLDNDNV